VRPSITKPLTEFVLAASTHPKGRPLPVADEAVRQTVFASKQAHSAKPEQVQASIEALYPSLAKVELFARRRRDGWDAWGDEVEP
jgi:N6-adenosine-specific RNA methylase IME4